MGVRGVLKLSEGDKWTTKRVKPSQILLIIIQSGKERSIKMQIYLSSHIHQGDESFDIQTRGKQCAINCLLGRLTAHKKPLVEWSPTTLNRILIQGDKLYLKAVNNGLINLAPGVEFLSVEDLRKVVSISCFQHQFSFDICCQSEQRIHTITTEVQSIDLPIEAQNTNLPVGAQNTNLPVGAQNINLPVGAQNINLHVEAQSIQLSIGAQNIESHDIEMSYVAQENNLPAEATNICQHNVSTNEENVCVIHCEQELQGLVLITNKEIPSYYYKIHTALTNTFIKCKYAFLILEGYIMALIKQEEWFYLFDPHARVIVWECLMLMAQQLLCSLQTF